MFIAMKEHVMQYNRVTQLCVLIVFGQQWSSMRNKTY